MPGIYEEKYLKYKKKYLDLKKQSGGDAQLGSVAFGPDGEKILAPVPKLGVIRLDYDYETAVGDVDNPQSFPYPVEYRVVPGLTFAICQEGGAAITEQIKQDILTVTKLFHEDPSIKMITGDCGFMINIQDIVNEATDKPVVMSSLIALPSLCALYDKDETIAVFTANSVTLDPILDKLLAMSAIKPEHKDRLQIVGCQDVPGFDAVEKGEKVDVEKVTPGMAELALKTIRANQRIKCILLECTELPPYADSLKYVTGLPVYDSISTCDQYMMGFQDRPQYGLQDMVQQWDGIRKPYSFGQNLNEDQKSRLVNHSQDPEANRYDVDHIPGAVPAGETETKESEKKETVPASSVAR